MTKSFLLILAGLIILQCNIDAQVKEFGTFDLQWNATVDEHPKFKILKYTTDINKTVAAKTEFNQIVYDAIDQKKWQLQLSEQQLQGGWSQKTDPFVYYVSGATPRGFGSQKQKKSSKDYSICSLKQSIIADPNKHFFEAQLLNCSLINIEEHELALNKEITARPSLQNSKPSYTEDQISMIYQVELQLPLISLKGGSEDLKTWVMNQYFEEETKIEFPVYEDLNWEQPMVKEDLAEKFYLRDTIFMTNSMTFESEMHTISKKIEPSEIEKIAIIQNWYFEKDTDAIYCELVAMSLLLPVKDYTDEEEEINYLSIGWLRLNAQ
ncbi:MAG: hypothetical protein Sapg2KO_01310 [Saprospiraceae bacterium]